MKQLHMVGPLFPSQGTTGRVDQGTTARVAKTCLVCCVCQGCTDLFGLLCLFVHGSQSLPHASHAICPGVNIVNRTELETAASETKST